MNLSACWSHICGVDVAPWVQWLTEDNHNWPTDLAPNKPARVHEDGLPIDLLQSTYGVVLPHFGDSVMLAGLPNIRPVVAHAPMLSLMKPGQSHPYHVDRQRADWITRVHVPLTTNPGCWMAWEKDGGEHVHFDDGNAYTFNTLERHAFGNDGKTERVHLIFEVLTMDA